MARVADFSFIIRDDRANIDRSRNFPFSAENPTDEAQLTFMVRALGDPNYEEPTIRINGIRVEQIRRTSETDRNTWFTQVVNVAAGVLRNGTNTLEVAPAERMAGVTSGPAMDTYELRDAVCHYKKSI